MAEEEVEETVKIIPNFKYPFSKISNEDEYLGALSSVTSGNYLFNSKGMWHGGIHFANQALITVDASKGINCIANGELVAYRINDDYLENADALYSNGFFLVKHKMEYPKENKLTFFSLYMHTAKKSEYYTHTIKGSGRFIRKGYAPGGDNAYGTKEFDDGTKIFLDSLWTTRRARVISIENEEVDDSVIPTIHDTNVEKHFKFADRFEEVIKGEVNKTVVLETPIPIKEGETIALVGEYNLSEEEEKKLFHLEVFTGDDIKSFADTAKAKFSSDTTDSKLKATKLIVPKNNIIYTLKNIITTSLTQADNIRSEFNHTSSKYLGTQTTSGTSLEIDIDTLQGDRYLVLKIAGVDVSSSTWTVHKGSITLINEFEDSSSKTLNKETLALSGLKKIKDQDDKEYFEYKENTPKQYIKYEDCTETHPITFEWAEIIDSTSSDDISIFKNFKDIIDENTQTDNIEINELFTDIFKLIDSNENDKIESAEISKATQDKELKKVCSRFIVKHSSEWHKDINLPEKVIEIVNSLGDDVNNKEDILNHLENEKLRVEKLDFFNDCNEIEGFPSSDKVFHINAIGLVSEFENSVICGLTGDLLKELLNKSILFNHGTMTSYADVYKTDVNKFAEIFNMVIKRYPEFNKCIYVAHFLAQAFHEADHFYTTKEYASGWDYDIRTYPASVCTTYGNNSRKCRRHNQIIAEGNTSIGDGPKYKGKGLIQLTWKGTYQEYSNFKGIDFVNEPDLIASNLEYAIDASCWFWVKFKGENYFNNLIDLKELEYKDLSEEVKNDLIVESVTRRVNGGTRGLVERQELFKKIIEKVKG